MERIALFPGSFDPITCGHEEIIRRSLKLFDRVIVGIGINSQKVNMYSAAQRQAWLEQLFAEESRIRVATFQGLTVQFARAQGAQFLLRGLRAAPDFEYEKNIDLLNQHLAENLQTVYLISSPATAHISSTLVREVIRFKGNLKGLVPDFMIPEIYADTPAGAA